jgi:hypothetical protein
MPFVWSSPIWFPLMVGAATASLAEQRLHPLDPRTTVTARQALAAVRCGDRHVRDHRARAQRAAGSGTALIIAMAAITWCALGDKASVVCGVLAVSQNGGGSAA